MSAKNKMGLHFAPIPNMRKLLHCIVVIGIVKKCSFVSSRKEKIWEDGRGVVLKCYMDFCLFILLHSFLLHELGYYLTRQLFWCVVQGKMGYSLRPLNLHYHTPSPNLKARQRRTRFVHTYWLLHYNFSKVERQKVPKHFHSHRHPLTIPCKRSWMKDRKRFRNLFTDERYNNGKKMKGCRRTD